MIPECLFLQHYRWQQGPQPQRYTTYLRDENRSDDAQMRRYNSWWNRFDQPDPFDGILVSVALQT